MALAHLIELVRGPWSTIWHMDEQRVRMIEGSLVSSIERAMRRMDEQDPLTWAQVTLLLCESLAVLRDSRLGLELPAEAEEPLTLGQGG